MNMVFLMLLFSATVDAKSLVVVSFFDAFGGASFNNSERVARALEARFRNNPEVTVQLCGLETVFERSFGQIEDCVRSLPSVPSLVLGLGETGCNLKAEIMGRNLDHSFGPDNSGVMRKSSPINPDGPQELGLRYPLAQMYCALSPRERRMVFVSNDAGSFVCNNVAYQYAWRYPEQRFGFIHVPSNDCRNLDRKNEESIVALEKMIAAAAATEASARLPVRKIDLQILRERHREDGCLSEFYKRAKGADERGPWRSSATP